MTRCVRFMTRSASWHPIRSTASAHPTSIRSGGSPFSANTQGDHGLNMGGVALSGIQRNRDGFGPGVLFPRHTELPESRKTPGQPEKGGEQAVAAHVDGRGEIREPEDEFLERVSECPRLREAVLALEEIERREGGGARGYGLLAGIDVRAKDGQPGLAGHEVQKRLFDAGLPVKATSDALLLAPAFVATPAQVDEMIAILRSVLAQIEWS